MKRFWMVLSVALTGLVLSASLAAAQAKIGFIDSRKLIAEAPGAKEAQQTLERELQGYQSGVQGLQGELERLRTQLAGQQGTPNAQQQQAFQQKLTVYQDSVRKIEQTVQQRQQQLVSPIMQRINTAVEAVRTEGGYAMIFDASAGALITADPALDLTDRVLARLRQQGAG
ncbi:hypothetical protein BH20GEM2_BH20GEM2_07570 [soil metagenome]|jgi:outer membrane protein